MYQNAICHSEMEGPCVTIGEAMPSAYPSSLWLIRKKNLRMAPKRYSSNYDDKYQHLESNAYIWKKEESCKNW